MICTNRVELSHELARIRKMRGVSQLEFDHRIGWQLGYVGKLEQPDKPYGRNACHQSFDEWLQGLRCGVVIVPLRPAPKRRYVPPAAQLCFSFMVGPEVPAGRIVKTTCHPEGSLAPV